uniref:Integrase catalytic domain-containing protein n=1 Tax=Strigamia maritima TaxID=126957 RepID=T1J144_STRMM
MIVSKTTQYTNKFVSTIFREFCEYRHIKLSPTSTYHPNANPTERTNRDLKTMLAIFTDIHSRWPRYLDEFAFVTRTKISEALGHSPMLLNTGRIVTLPFDPRLLKHAVPFDKIQPELYVQSVMDVLKQAHQNMYRMIQHKGLTSGMAAKRDGPWEITKLLGGGAYALLKLENGAVEKSVNTRDLVPHIPSFPVEVWSEDQTKAVDDAPPNPTWMNDDITDFLMEKNHPVQHSSTNSQVGDNGQMTPTPPSDKPRGKHHRVHLRRDAKKNRVPPKPHPAKREPRIRKPNPKYTEGFVTTL